MGDERKKALEVAIKAIEKRFGKGTVIKLGGEAVERPPVIPTGSLALDIALGVGGWPRGRIVEIFGPEGTGKTTLALYAMANAQREGGVVVFVDAEHALDLQYARTLGVDVGEVLFSQPDYGEQALEILENLVRSGAVDLAVVDSVAALVPKSEVEGTMEDVGVGTQARLMTKAIRKLTGIVSKSNTAVLFINQLRFRIGGNFYGPQETTPGGNALKYQATIRVEVRRGASIRRGNEVVGHELKIKTVKNKLAPPYRTATLELIYGKGLSREGELVNLGLEYEVLRRSGSWIYYGDEQLGQGKERVAELLRENPELAQEIERKIREAAGLSTAQGEPRD